MNSLYRVLSWNCCGPKLEKMGETVLSKVPKGVCVLYYRDGKKYLTPKNVEPYWDENTLPFEYYFEGDDEKLYLIVDEEKEKEWDRLNGIDDGIFLKKGREYLPFYLEGRDCRKY